MRSNRGFTLVELIVTMVVLSILALGSTQFITDAANGYVATNARTQLANQARLALNRIAQEVRGALPGSVRVAGNCLEFIPAEQASRYVSLPVGTSASSFLAARLPTGVVLNNLRVAVFPATNPYVLTGNSSISPVVTVSAPDPQNQVTVSMASAHQFPSLSPRDRFYFVAEPTSYCVDAGHLWRYQDYGYLDPQPNTGLLPAALPGRSLFAENAQATFLVSSATLERSSALSIELTVSQNNDSVRLQHLAQIRNVP